jgi:hypothetical protein
METRNRIDEVLAREEASLARLRQSIDLNKQMIAQSEKLLGTGRETGRQEPAAP